MKRPSLLDLWLDELGNLPREARVEASGYLIAEMLDAQRGRARGKTEAAISRAVSLAGARAAQRAALEILGQIIPPEA